MAAACDTPQATLSQMPSLKSLGLGNCGLSCEILLPGVAALQSLQQPSVHENTLLLERAVLLENQFSVLTALQKLSIRSIGLKNHVDMDTFGKHDGYKRADNHRVSLCEILREG